MPLLETFSPGNWMTFCAGDDSSDESSLSHTARSSVSPASINGSGEVAECLIQPRLAVGWLFGQLCKPGSVARVTA